MKVESPHWEETEHGTFCVKHNYAEVFLYCRQCAADKCRRIVIEFDDFDELALMVGDAMSYRDFLPANGDLDYFFK